MIPTIDEAADVALDVDRKGNRLFWLRLTAWAAIGWLLLIPAAWKVLVLVLSSLLKIFLSSGPGGEA